MDGKCLSAIPGWLGRTISVYTVSVRGRPRSGHCPAPRSGIPIRRRQSDTRPIGIIDGDLAILLLVTSLTLNSLHLERRVKERKRFRETCRNHLPHIYNALQKIAAQQGIELDDTPLVRFVDLNGHSHHK